ncbi:MAG: alpha/beta hydrolase-fold protein [Prolixibacteraceae bacterium]|nr:alpha/beta hydrolase-fold protein [Prolixibacteraceae bacterium]
MIKTVKKIAFVGILAGFSLTGNAQFPVYKPTPGDTLKSIRISADKKVTFSIYAPKASEVTVSGDFQQTYGALKLQKDQIGIWSVTTDPITPDLYTYDFSVDGMKVIDPKNIQLKEGAGGYSNLLEVQGKEADYLAVKNVPHGKLEKVWFNAGTLGKTSRVHVYTPPGYENMKGRLPVLYLQHGGGDNDASWATAGRANFILDNLLVKGKVKPMIVVMPFGNPGGGFFSGAGVDADPYYNYFFKDLVPYIESHYNAGTTRESRAYAGLSMGGLQALNMGIFYPEKFAYVLPLSTGFFPEILKSMEEKYASNLKNPEINKLKLFWIAMGGEKDIAYQNGENTKALFDKFGVKYQTNSYPAGHTFITWRHNLDEFAPLLFK